MIEMIAAPLKVIEIARLKKSCRCCEKMVQCPAPSRPIPGSLAGPSLLAFILVSKFDDHVPLYRLTRSSPGWAPTFPIRRWPIGAAARCGR
jgi:transposase